MTKTMHKKISYGILSLMFLCGLTLASTANAQNSADIIELLAAQGTQVVKDGTLSDTDSLRNSIWIKGGQSNMWEIHFPGNTTAAVGNYTNCPGGQCISGSTYRMTDFSDVKWSESGSTGVPCLSDETCRNFLNQQAGFAYTAALSSGEGMYIQSNCGNTHVFIARQDKCANVTGFQWLADAQGKIYVKNSSNALDLYTQTDSVTRQCTIFNPDLCANIDNHQATIPAPMTSYFVSGQPYMVPPQGMTVVGNQCIVSCTSSTQCDGSSSCQNNICVPPLIATCTSYRNSTATIPATLFHAGDTVYFKAKAGGGTGVYSYAWTGVGPSNGSAAQNTYATDGSYSATVTVTDSNSQTRSATCNINVGCIQNSDCPTSGQICSNGQCTTPPFGNLTCTVQPPSSVPVGPSPHTFQWLASFTGGTPPYTYNFQSNVHSNTYTNSGNNTGGGFQMDQYTVPANAPAQAIQSQLTVIDSSTPFAQTQYSQCDAAVVGCASNNECPPNNICSPAGTTCAGQCIPDSPTILIDLSPELVAIGKQCTLNFTADNVLSCRIMDVVRDQQVGKKFTSAGLGPITTEPDGIDVEPGIYQVVCENGAVCGGANLNSSQVRCVENIDIREN